MIVAPHHDNVDDADDLGLPDAQPPLQDPPAARSAARSGSAAQKASARSCVLTLINCAVGAPLLSLPFAYQQTGWVTGIILTVFIAALEALTLFTLASHAEKTRSATYSALVHKMLGPAASVLLSLVTIAFAFGSCCAYLMILADSVQPLLEAATGGASADEWWGRRESIIVVLGAGVMLPLSFPDSLDALSGASSIALCGLVTIVAAVAFNTLRSDHDWHSMPAVRFSSGFFSSLPILIYGFQSHTNVVAVFHELEDEPVLLPKVRSLARLTSFASMAALSQLPINGRMLPDERLSTELPLRTSPANGTAADAAAAAAAAAAADTSPADCSSNRSEASCDEELLLWDGADARQEAPEAPAPPRSAKLLGMIRVVYTAIGLTAAMYCLLGLFGYLAFSSKEIGPNILDMYPPGDPAIQVARVMLALIQLVSYPINLLPARAAIWHLIEAAASSRLHQLRRTFHALSTLAFFSATLAVALATTDLGMMFQLIGGTCGAILIFGMPGGLLMGHAWQQHGPPRLKHQPPQLAILACGDPESGPLHLKQLSEHEEAVEPPAGVLLPGWLGSNLFWAGLALVLLTAALCAYSLHLVLAPS